MSITVANFILYYLRPSLPNATDFSDATLGYWIDAALLDISRSFPRKTWAMWAATTGNHAYAYADSTTIADETTIIRVLNCSYPYVDSLDPGDVMDRRSHFDTDFEGGNYYDPDNEGQVLYIGAQVLTTKQIYADCHLYWKVATTTISNPSEHYELIRLFVIWQAYMHQTSDAASSPTPDTALINALNEQTQQAYQAYLSIYDKLDQAKATSGVASGWRMDKWDGDSGVDSEYRG
jgi:hypothetical protein